MSTKTTGNGVPNPLAEKMCQLAAQEADPLERKSLLDSAAKVDAADAMLQQAIASAQDSVVRIRSEMDALKRRNDLPTWAVVFVLSAFALFLVYVALKHHV
jgi:hypothetical protein